MIDFSLADKSVGKPVGKSVATVWAHDPRNPFREGSAYAACFNILTAHPEGMTREDLVE